MPDGNNPISQPRVKLAQIVDAWRRDLEALVDANYAASENLRVLSSQQRETLTEAMQKIVDVHGDSVDSTEERERTHADVAQELWAQALTEMKTSCESAFRSQTDAMKSISGSTSRHLLAIQSLLERQVVPG